MLLVCVGVVVAHCSREATAPTTGVRSAPLETNRDALDRRTIDNESRFVLRGRSNSFAVQVPAGATLSVGVGVSLVSSLNFPAKQWPDDLQHVDFTVAYEDHSGRRALAQQRVTRPAVGTGAWNDLVVDLGALAGAHGTLHFDATSVPAQTALDRDIVWTNPRLISPAPTVPTSVILISIDTLRADALGCYGYPRPTSPNTDRMAREGVLFRDVIASSSWTLPAHVSMLTGLDPDRHGVVKFSFFHPLADELETLAERLWDAGYETGGLIGGGFVSNDLGFDQGCDRQWENPDSSGRTDTLHAVVDRAKPWLAERRGRPFFLFLHTYHVHLPFEPPPPYDTMFDPGYDGPYKSRLTEKDAFGLVRAKRLGPRLMRHARALYDGEIRDMDAAMGNLVSFLRSTGLDQHTCVLVTSDHGEEFGEHDGFSHGRAKVYEELIRVPLIVWCPSRVPRGRVVEDLASLTDVMPTVLELAGIAVPDGLDGRSLAPALHGASSPRRAAAISEVDGSVDRVEGTVRAVRGPRHKLIASTIDGSELLFDLQADPGERADLRQQAPALARQLRALGDDRARGPAVAAAPAITPDDAMQERLRALGYIE